MDKDFIKQFPNAIGKMSRILGMISGIAIILVIVVTVMDIILRAAGYPLAGAFEVVALSGALILGLGIPFTSWTRSHVYMEFMVDRLSERGRNILNTFTRAICTTLFLVIGVNLFRVAYGMSTSGEVSSALKLPIYPFAYGLAIACFLECLVFVSDIIKIWEGKYE